MKVLAIEGGVSRELLSFMGRVIVHDSKKELEFLFPKYRDGQIRIVEVVVEGGTLQDGRPVMRLRDHPDMDTVQWPLDERDFVQLTGQTRRQEHEIIAAGVRKAAREAPSPAQRQEWEQRWQNQTAEARAHIGPLDEER